MPPTNTAFKRGPRARACDICRRWKKKCDQLKPACSRCSKSNLTCTYSYVKEYYQNENPTFEGEKTAYEEKDDVLSPLFPRRRSLFEFYSHSPYNRIPSPTIKEPIFNEPLVGLTFPVRQRKFQSLPSLKSLSLPCGPRQTRRNTDPSAPISSILTTEQGNLTLANPYISNNISTYSSNLAIKLRTNSYHSEQEKN